jgi:mRNA interferase RelE/StbE
MEVEFTRSGERSFNQLPRDRQQQVLNRIEQVAGGGRGDVQRLAGESGLYRLRVGDYRVLFSIDEEAQLMRIELIRTRGDVYKR